MDEADLDKLRALGIASFGLDREVRKRFSAEPKLSGSEILDTVVAVLLEDEPLKHSAGVWAAKNANQINAKLKEGAERDCEHFKPKGQRAIADSVHRVLSAKPKEPKIQNVTRGDIVETIEQDGLRKRKLAATVGVWLDPDDQNGARAQAMVFATMFDERERIAKAPNISQQAARATGEVVSTAARAAMVRNYFDGVVPTFFDLPPEDKSAIERQWMLRWPKTAALSDKTWRRVISEARTKK